MIFRQKGALEDFQLLKKAPAAGLCLCLTMRVKPPLNQIWLSPGKTTTKQGTFPAARAPALKPQLAEKGKAARENIRLKLIGR